MKTGSISFTGRASGLQMSELTVESDHPNIESLVCTISQEGHIELQVNLNNLYDDDWPNQNVVQEAEQLLAILSLKYNCRIHSLRETGYSLKSKDGSDTTSVSASHTLVWDSAEATIRPGKASIEKFLRDFKELQYSPFPKIYSAAMRQQDAVTRFMFLYNIVLMLANDKQAEADGHILRIACDTPTSISPHRPNERETIYTRLRNEIAHNRKGTDFDSTSSEISDRVSKLGEITKQLILENA